MDQNSQNIVLINSPCNSETAWPTIHTMYSFLSFLDNLL